MVVNAYAVTGYPDCTTVERQETALGRPKPVFIRRQTEHPLSGRAFCPVRECCGGCSVPELARGAISSRPGWLRAA